MNNNNFIELKKIKKFLCMCSKENTKGGVYNKYSEKKNLGNLITRGG
jgi:hypothetical protein